MWKWNICITLPAPPRPAPAVSLNRVTSSDLSPHRRQCAKTHFHLENVCKLCQFFCQVIFKHNFVFYCRRCWSHIRAWNECQRINSVFQPGEGLLRDCENFAKVRWELYSTSISTHWSMYETQSRSIINLEANFLNCFFWHTTSHRQIRNMWFRAKDHGMGLSASASQPQTRGFLYPLFHGNE